jgi:DNA polymerase alpha-associated DNA helicase A
MICQFLKYKNTILICGPSNISIGNIIYKFMNSLFYKSNRTSFYRVGSSSKGIVNLNIENMAEEAVSFMNKNLKDAERKGSSKKKEERWAERSWQEI